MTDYEFLTKTEKEILKFLAQGLTMEDILEKMCIAQTTFKSHLNDIFQKLQLSKGKKGSNSHIRIRAVLIYLKENNKLKDWKLEF
ncbi:helix-turn-helix transcriptional regulator [bacterium]|nr:helix-turn-helix transcriptional regulator [bacterium]